MQSELQSYFQPDYLFRAAYLKAYRGGMFSVFLNYEAIRLRLRVGIRTAKRLADNDQTVRSNWNDAQRRAMMCEYTGLDEDFLFVRNPNASGVVTENQ